MITPLDYLEAAKIQELVSELRESGYEVLTENGGISPSFDITAVKNGKKLAFEVKAQSRLTESLEEIRQLRRRAREEEYTGFRLVVVNPPKKIDAYVHGLDKTLCDRMMAEIPFDLQRISAKVTGVDQLEIQKLHIFSNSLQVSGTGLAQVSGSQDRQNDRSESDWEDYFLFTFDCELNSDLSVAVMYPIKVEVPEEYHFSTAPSFLAGEGAGEEGIQPSK